MIKNFIKYLFNQLGYTISKNAKKNLQADLEFKGFQRNYSWLKELNINTIIDVGANEGQFASKIMKLLPLATIHCFEPIPEAFRILQNTVGQSENSNLYNFALGDKEEDLNFNQNEYTPSSSFLPLDDLHKNNFDYAVTTRPINIHVKKLDDLNLSITERALVKIDVQGFEIRVLKGGEKTLNNIHVAVIEVAFKKLYEEQPLFTELIDLMQDNGFEFKGFVDPLISSIDGQVLQGDAFFLKKEYQP